MALGSAAVIWIGFVVPVLWVTFMVYSLGTRPMLRAMVCWLVVRLGQACLMQVIGLARPAGA